MSIGIDGQRFHVNMKIAGRIVLVVFAITVIFVGPARIGLLGADYAEAMVRYGSPLRSIYGDPGKVTDELIERYRTLNTLPGQEVRRVNRPQLPRGRQHHLRVELNRKPQT